MHNVSVASTLLLNRTYLFIRIKFRKLFIYSSLPSCKDFQLEFDCVFFNNSYFNLEFGWDSKYLTANDVNNLSPCSTVYTYSVNSGNIRKGVLATGLSTTNLTNYIGSAAPTSNSYANCSRIFYARVKSEMVTDVSSTNDQFNYFRQKLHIKLIRKGKEFKSYMNDILVHRYIDSNLETDAGGYFAISKTVISNANLSAKFGIANVVLKHN